MARHHGVPGNPKEKDENAENNEEIRCDLEELLVRCLFLVLFLNEDKASVSKPS